MDQHGASVLGQIIAHVNDFGDVLLPRLRSSGRVAQTGKGVGCDSRPEAAPGTQQLGAVALFEVSPANADHSQALDPRQIHTFRAPARLPRSLVDVALQLTEICRASVAGLQFAAATDRG